MKQKVIFTLLAVLLAAVFLPVLLLYISPMENASYDLSLICEDGQPWQGEKGWTVYTNTAGTVKELTSHGTGAYSGLDYDGQTFYFSRQLTEDLDSPTLRIGAVNRTFSVFLDDELIYTDCPELDNRIGYLELPMLEYGPRRSDRGFSAAGLPRQDPDHRTVHIPARQRCARFGRQCIPCIRRALLRLCIRKRADRANRTAHNPCSAAVCSRVVHPWRVCLEHGIRPSLCAPASAGRCSRSG